MSAISGPVPHARPPFVRPLAALYLIGAACWLAWRLMATSSGTSPALFLALLAIDGWSTARLATLAAPWALRRARPPKAASRAGAPDRPISTPQGEIVVVVGSESTAQLRIAAWSCGFVTGAGRVVVLDVLGRASVRDTCERLGLERVEAGGWSGVGTALDRIAASSSSAVLALVPARCAVLPDLFVATTPLLGGGVNAVSVPTTVVADPGLFAGAGYDVGSDADADTVRRARGVARVLDGPLVVRTLALRQVGAGTGRRSWVGTGRRLAASGGRVAVAPRPLALERAPSSEAEALRRRWRAVRGDRTDRSVPRLSRLDAAAPVARLVSFALVPLVAWTGQLPVTVSGRDLALVVAPWWLLSTATRRAVRPDGWAPVGSLRRDVRTLGTDLHAALGRGEEPTVVRLVRFQRTTALGLVLCGVLAALPIFGVRGGSPLPDLASAVLASCALLVLVLARDTLWAATERQRRSLPREDWSQAQPVGPFRILDVSPLGMFVTAPPSMQVTDVVDVDLALPLPGRDAVPARRTAVVAQVRPGAGVLLQFDLDDDLFDELLYFTAVTLPMLRRLGVRTRPVERIRTTVRRAPVPDPAPWMAGVLAAARDAGADRNPAVGAGLGR